MTEPALHFENQSWTYPALQTWIAQETELLATEGISKGDRVAILALNHPRTLILLFACARLGAILSPLNWRLAPPELAWILENAAPKLLFTDETAPPTTPTSTKILALKPSPSGRGLGEGPPAQERAPLPTLPNQNTPLLLVYTSGTTGRPKGALLTDTALNANATLSHHMHALTPSDHVLTTLPLFHVGGLNIQTLPALLHGASITLHPRFDPTTTLATIAQSRPTLTVLVPATLQALTAHPAFPTTDLSSLRAITTGSTVVQPVITAPFAARGIPILQVYGSTETAPIAIYTPIGHTLPPESTGHPGPHCTAIAIDDRGHETSPGTPGEILLQGPQLFREYWRNPEATNEAFQGPWFRTGDIGTLTPQGWIVHDRKKNLIVSGGENIYPAEIERVLHEIPEIAEAAVIAAPHPVWQEVPEAHIVLHPGAQITEAEIIAHLRTQLARFKSPRRIHIVQSLPKNALGKIQHTFLKKPSPSGRGLGEGPPPHQGKPMLTDRIEGKWLDAFREVLEACAVKPNDPVAILSETQSRPLNLHLTELALHLLKARAFHLVLPTPRNPHPVPIRSTGASEALAGLPPVLAALAASTLIVDLTLEGLMHARETAAILKSGARILHISNEHPEALERLRPDPALEPQVRNAARALRAAHRMTVTSPHGTNLQIDLRGANTVGVWGWTTKPGTLAHWPGGLVVAFPAANTVNGRLILAPGDLNLTFKRYLEQPVTLTIENDYVTTIEGQGTDATLFREYLAAWNDPEAYAVSHVGWGLNPRARHEALAMYGRRDTNGTELRAVAGNFLFSTGANEFAGRHTPGHFDLPVMNTTITLDDTIVVQDGVPTSSEP